MSVCPDLKINHCILISDLVLLHLLDSLALTDAQATDVVHAILQTSRSVPASTASTPSPVLAAPVTPSRQSVSATPVPLPPTISAPPPIMRVTPVDASFDYHVPLEDEEGPFYIVTRGTDVGVFAGW